MDTGPTGTRPAVNGEIAFENALTLVAFPFFTKVKLYCNAPAGSGLLTMSCKTFGVKVKKLFCKVCWSTMKTGAFNAAGVPK